MIKINHKKNKKVVKKTCANYNVGLKVLLKKGDEFLFLKSTMGICFDLPGGRIDDTEHNIPLTRIIDREVKEELGIDIKYKLGKPAFQYRRYFKHKKLWIFITIYEAEYISGKIKLSEEHSSYKWVKQNDINFKQKDFLSKEEYIELKKYFKNL